MFILINRAVVEASTGRIGHVDRVSTIGDTHVLLSFLE